MKRLARMILFYSGDHRDLGHRGEVAFVAALHVSSTVGSVGILEDRFSRSQLLDRNQHDA